MMDDDIARLVARMEGQSVCHMHECVHVMRLLLFISKSVRLLLPPRFLFRVLAIAACGSEIPHIWRKVIQMTEGRFYVTIFCLIVFAGCGCGCWHLLSC